MSFESLVQTVFLDVAVICALYVIGASLCRLRYCSNRVKHAWKLIYVVMLGLAGWALCDLLTDNFTMFQVAVCVAVAMYIQMTKAAWTHSPPAIAQTQILK